MLMFIPDGIPRCECGHISMLHYLEETSDDYAGCILTECKCVKFAARTDSKGEAKEQR